jgi:hypothetical protein
MPRPLLKLIAFPILLLAIEIPAAPMSNSPFSASSGNDLQSLVQLFQADESDLSRLYPISTFDQAMARRREWLKSWQTRVEAVNLGDLSPAGLADQYLFRNYLAKEVRELDITRARQEKIRVIVPFAPKVTGLEETRRQMEIPDAPKVAQSLTDLSVEVVAATKKLDEPTYPATEGFAALGLSRRLRDVLSHWFSYYNGYDPLFTWWVEAPYRELSKNLDAFVAALEKKVNGDAKAPIVGQTAGRDALLADLAYEQIPYSPEELIAIGEKEYAWCETEMKRAAKELGFGDDWKKALEHVKQKYVEPGQQPALIKKLALEAIEFVEKRDLVTVPPDAKTSWGMEMMSPERQLVNPFFLGGDTIIVSYPTNGMTQEQKMMSMRGNNPYFSRATVQHELIPGHHLQGYMEARYRPYRQQFSTPFWTEGWALYWEMLLWDLGFPRTPEERVGMLFWRMHRCMRIEFSLKFHLGQMTPAQCVDLLVDRVGHERATAEGEVRRSLNGSYPPLYQAAYMIGGLQFRALHRELVDSGKMTNRQFHDAILHENNIPVAAVRAILEKQPFPATGLPAWRFYDSK